MKKILSILLSLCILSSGVNVFAEEKQAINVKDVVESFDKNTTVLDMDFESDCLEKFGNLEWANNVKKIDGEHGCVFEKLSNVATPWVKLDEPITEGLVYVNMDLYIPSAVQGKLSYLRMVSSPFTAVNADNDPYMAETFLVDLGTMQSGFYPASAGWTRKYNDKFNEKEWYSISMWLDLDRDRIYYLFNNKYMGYESSAPDILTDFAGLAMSATADIWFDNISVTKVSRNTLDDIKAQGVNLPDELFESFFLSALIGGTGNMSEHKNEEIPAAVTISSIAEDDTEFTAKLRAVDEDGNTIYQGEENVISKAGADTSFEFKLPGLSKYGFYYLYVDLMEKATGEILASDNFQYTLVRLPEYGLKNEKFGIINHVRHTRMGDPLINLEFIDKAGFSTTRSEHTWQTYEKVPGEYQMTDAYIRHVTAKTPKNIGHLEILAFENYAVHPESPPVSDEALDLFTDYGVQFVSDLKEIVGDNELEVEVWNEYNGKAEYFNKSNQPPESYAKMLKATYSKLKQHHPDVKIWGGGTIGVANAWLERVIKAGGGDYVDGISIHPYTNKSSPERGGAIPQIIALKEMLAENGYPDMPLRATEWGWPSTGINGYVDKTEQAAYIVRMNVLNDHYDFFEHIDYYTINDGGEDMTNAEHAFGLLYGPKNKVPFGTKPAYLSATTFNDLMTDAQYIDMITLGENVSAYRYKLRDGRDCVVAWKIDAGVEIAGVNLGANQVTKIDMYGNESELFAQDGVFTCAYDITPTYLVGDFDKMETAKAGFSLSANEIEIVAGDKAEILLYQYSDKKGTIEVLGTDDIILYENNGFTGDVLRLVVASKSGSKLNSNINITVKDADKVLFSTDIPISYAEKTKPGIMIKPKTLEQADMWEAVFSVKNNAYSEKVDARVELIYPENVSGTVFELSDILPGKEGSFIYNIPPYIVSNNNVNIKARVDISTGESYEIEENVGLNSCAYMEKKPVIDGVVNDGEWNKNSAIDLEKGGKYVYLAGEAYRGTEDLSGKFYIAWDEENFYMAAQMTDDVFSDDKLEGGILWRSDGIQFAMAEYRGASSVSQFDIAKVGGKNLVQVDRHPDSDMVGMLDAENYELEIGREGNITTYELKLPWKIIFSEDYTVAKNGELAMSFMVNENDGDVRRGYFEYGSGIGTGTADTSVYNKYFMLGSRLMDELK